ncbi:MAG: bifunctional diaminohydroxyphosphoribosylaminopyrimidine deaminase/5-amino-6-(5-phosphoribosylamino)uracil reductase RibD [Myxococcota bacterium]
MSDDEAFMRLALEAAKKGVGFTSPNPAVGAVIVKNGAVLAIGWHRKAGTDHAEVAALRQLEFSAEGATLYSTLEPCNHFGRTGPCTEAILGAGIRRVVVGATDPNPLVRGKGLKKLRRHGVEVDAGLLAAEAERINEAYNHSIVAKGPFVVLKAATSLDGKIATRAQDSQWITSEAARAQGRALRGTVDAILVGVNTVLADDPALTVRSRGRHDPLRVIMDSRLRTPLTAAVVRTAKKTPTLIATTEKASKTRRKALERAGAEVLPLRATKAGQVEPEALLEALYAREKNGVLLEGGSSVHGAFLDRGLVHKVVWFLAPTLIGGQGALSALGGLGPAKLSEAHRLGVEAVGPVGGDLMIEARVLRARAKKGR